MLATVIWLGVGWVGCGASSDAPSPAPDRDAGHAEVGFDDGTGQADTSAADSGVSDASVSDTGTETVFYEDTGTGSGTDAADATGFANRCSEPYSSLVNASGPAPKVRSVPWKMLAGGSPSYREKTIMAVWRGVRELESTVTFDCPPSAEATGLKCETDEGLVLQHTAAGSARTLVFAVSIPIDRVEFPEKGTEVRLTYYSGDRDEGLEIRRERDRAPILALRASESDSGSNGRRANPEHFSNDYGTFEVAMEADIDRAESAYCLTTDYCKRLLRIEPLSLEAEKNSRVRPGSNQRFVAADVTYRFWHLVSFRRNQKLGPESSCADVTYPLASYAFARLK